MLKFRDAMESYASCLGETSADQKKAADDEYDSVRIQFNRRARAVSSISSISCAAS